jgi:uncharacterized DUF497 family protein
VDVEFDPERASAKLAKYAFSIADAEQALRDPSAVTFGDPDATVAPRFVTFGRDSPALRAPLAKDDAPLTVRRLRDVLREELRRA